jgi:hypothetical protein
VLQQCKPTAKLTADDARKMKVAELRTEPIARLANRDIACKGELKAGLVIAVLRGVARPHLPGQLLQRVVFISGNE